MGSPMGPHALVSLQEAAELSPMAEPTAGGLKPEHSPSPCSAPGPPASEGTAPAPFAALIPILSSLRCSLARYPKQLQGFFCTNYKGISQIGEFRVSHSENASDEIAAKGRAAQGAPGIGLGSPPAPHTCSWDARALGARCQAVPVRRKKGARAPKYQ